jgi:hypothetical protein
MKKFTNIIALSLFLVLSVFSLAFSGDGINTCGYEMIVVPVQQASVMYDTLNTPAILDTWTTNNPFVSPPPEVYDFTTGQDTIGYVVQYNHIGGPLPEQWAKGWKCGTDIPVKTCKFAWTIGYLPPGVYLLINYFDPVTYPPGSYDWASKVGDEVKGWPDMSARPDCFTVH